MHSSSAFVYSEGIIYEDCRFDSVEPKVIPSGLHCNGLKINKLIRAWQELKFLVKQVISSILELSSGASNL